MWAPVHNVSNFSLLKKSVFGLAQGHFSPGFSGASCFWLVGNAIRISCLEPGNVEGMGNNNEFRTQSKINGWRVPLSQTVYLIGEYRHYYHMGFGLYQNV